MKALLIDNSGEDPIMVAGEVPEPKPSKHELLVKVEATALNRADLLQKIGKYPVPDGASSILGLEMAGRVEQVGDGVKKFSEGDAVFGLLPGGGYAQKCVIHEKMAMPLPGELSFEEAAAVPETFLTAYQAMFWLGELRPKETVLIHAGASGVGTSAIQLARELRSARIITTAGTDQKNDICKNLGSNLSINYKKQDYSETIEEAFGKDQVNLVIDFVGAPYWQKNLDLLAMDGRLVYLSFLGGAKVESANLVPLLRKRLTVMGSTLRNRNHDYKQRLTADFWKDAGLALQEGKIAPEIDSVFNWMEVEKAHSRMKNNQNAGKVVLTGMQD